MTKPRQAAPLESKPVEIDLPVSVSVSEGGLWFRQEIADGHLEHKGEQFEVEVATSIGSGGILVTIQRPKKKRAKGETWRVYQFSADALIRTCMDDYLVRDKVKRPRSQLRRRESKE